MESCGARFGRNISPTLRRFCSFRDRIEPEIAMQRNNSGRYDGRNDSDKCRNCGICKARKNGLCYYCVDSSEIDSSEIPISEGAA